MARQLGPIRYPAESTTTAFPSKATASGRQLFVPPKAAFSVVPAGRFQQAPSMSRQPNGDSHPMARIEHIPDEEGSSHDLRPHPAVNRAAPGHPV
jgi:hypothetical protein